MKTIRRFLELYIPFKERPFEYKSLQDSGEDISPISKVSRFQSRTLSFLAGLFLAFLVFLLSVTTVNLLSTTPKTAAEIEAEQWNYCGRSSEVAMQRGCVMEPLFYGWMPPQCAWKEFSDRWPVFEDRTWYSDFNLTNPVQKEDLWAGKHVNIYTHRYHGEHCLFQWRKLQYAMDEKKEFLDNKTISFHHTTHCADQLSMGCESPNDRNEVELGFYRCRKTIW